jgi:hypothetical protein
MHWDRPSPVQNPATTSDAIRVASHHTPARADSDAFSQQAAANISSLQRTLGLIAPSSWVLMTAALWWGWRVTAAFARDELSGVQAQPVALISGIIADLVMIQLVFVAARLTAVATTPAADIRHLYVTVVKRMIFFLFFASTLFRILDIVQSAMVHRPPDEEFWLTVIREPDLLVSGPVFGAIVIAIASTAIGRYAMNCDLEITQSVAEYWDQKKAITLTAGSLIVCAVLSLIFITGSPYGGRGRLVEIGAPSALIHALAHRSALLRPTLDK